MAVYPKPGNQWRPGMRSPNPRGRPKTGLALAEWIREVSAETDDESRGLLGLEMVRLAFRVALGRAVCVDAEWRREAAIAERDGQPIPPQRGECLQPTLSDMCRAQEWLANWGFSKPVQEHVLRTGPAPDELPNFDPSKLTEAELDALEALHVKASVIVDIVEPRPTPELPPGHSPTRGPGHGLA